MAILHGSWLLQNQGNCLFIWGETWRTLGVNASVRASSDVPQYPLAMKPAELLEWLRLRQITIASSIQQQVETSHGKSLPVRDDKKLTHSHIIALPSYFQQSSDGDIGISGTFCNCRDFGHNVFTIPPTMAS